MIRLLAMLPDRWFFVPKEDRRIEPGESTQDYRVSCAQRKLANETLGIGGGMEEDTERLHVRGVTR